jgi:hypothetical protein
VVPVVLEKVENADSLRSYLQARFPEPGDDLFRFPHKNPSFELNTPLPNWGKQT